MIPKITPYNHPINKEDTIKKNWELTIELNAMYAK